MFIVQMWGVSLCFMIHYSQIICWFMDILPFHFLFFSSGAEETVCGGGGGKRRVNRKREQMDKVSNMLEERRKEAKREGWQGKGKDRG